MLNYFLNKTTGALVALNTETNEITEFERVLGENESRGADTVGEKIKHHKKKYASRKMKIKTASKAKRSRECVECGKTISPDKYLCKGKCMTCYSRENYQKKHGAKSEKIKAPKLEREYECIDCGAVVTSNLNIDQVVCPKNEMHKLVQK